MLHYDTVKRDKALSAFWFATNQDEIQNHATRKKKIMFYWPFLRITSHVYEMDYIETGKNVNSEQNVKVRLKIQDSVYLSCSNTHKLTILQHDNAHIEYYRRGYSEWLKSKPILHSPNLPPCDFHFFPNLKGTATELILP